MRILKLAFFFMCLYICHSYNITMSFTITGCNRDALNNAYCRTKPNCLFLKTNRSVDTFVWANNFQKILPFSSTLITPPLELKTPKPFWKVFENLRFSLVNLDLRAKSILTICPEMTHSNSNRGDPSENFFLSSRRGGGLIKVDENGNCPGWKCQTGKLLVLKNL